MTHAIRTTDTITPAYDDIARKAYELYIQRGGEPGHEVDDWLEAERQLAISVQAETEVTPLTPPATRTRARATAAKPAAKRTPASRPVRRGKTSPSAS